MTETADPGLVEALLAAGIDRRRFLKYCATLTGLMALPPQFAPRVAAGLSKPDKPAVVYLEFQDCAGNTESMLRSRNPGVADVILDLVSLDYQETIMAAAGEQSREVRDATIAKGGHLVIVEGSIPLKDGGVYCTIGGESAEQIMKKAGKGAAAIINVGVCSAYGGLPAATPNPTGAVAIGDVVSGVPIVNLPGCPVNADNLTATIAHYLTFNELPATDNVGRPLFAYGARIHDNCERRGHFDAGQFVEQWGDEGHRKGYCLYRMGCKGPSTFHNCPAIRWNGSTSWPIQAGHGCVGCSEPHFWDQLAPLYDRLPNVNAAGVHGTAERLGLYVVGATAAGFAGHGIGKIVQNQVGKRRAGRPPEAPGDGGTPPAGSVPEGAARS